RHRPPRVSRRRRRSTSMPSAKRTFTATIGRTNDHGFQISERPGVWLNLSKFDDPQPIIPPAGTIAKLTLDGAGFVRAIEPVGSGDELAQPALPPPAHRARGRRV